MYLVPPTYEDLIWIFAQYQNVEIMEMFGGGDLGPAKILLQYRSGTLVVATIMSIATRRRIGFVVIYPPYGGDFNFWEIGMAITAFADRNAFNAINATDAVGYYMFSHLRARFVGWRIREDNLACDAMVRRVGYPAGETLEIGGHSHMIYRLDKAGWAKREFKIEAGEKQNADGIGVPYTILQPPMYEPRSQPETIGKSISNDMVATV
ncbi:MAG TPA: hypothetical protein VMH34_02620 [Gammaproteobacteria bacterium]|nr:hypothetical protein [Gammaproteobacteria bacterium]